MHDVVSLLTFCCVFYTRVLIALSHSMADAAMQLWVSYS